MANETLISSSSLNFGIDGGGDASTGPCGLSFYIGQLGAGTSIGAGPCYSGACFNIEAANQVGASNTYGYWFVFGPSRDPNYDGSVSTAKQWGINQGNQAIQAWNTNSYVARLTIFADIEGYPGMNGWVNNTGLNQAVWEGWYSIVQAGNGGELIAGVYSAPDAWNEIMGSSYTLYSSTPTWSYEPQNGCGSSCPTIYSYDAESFGGVYPVIWQYAQNCGNYGDLDAASELPN
ncbi:hypothetical protein ACOJUR_14160 [Alicyclobacillus tolerans]|uniref:hypothetical protein n=1 Tax=Alicyclobacillus tolerans TaxID=90970 RepID=UPI003B82A466